MRFTGTSCNRTLAVTVNANIKTVSFQLGLLDDLGAFARPRLTLNVLERREYTGL
jgi:hypothetical protein